MSNKKPNLSNVIRNNIAQFLLGASSNGKPASGKIKEAATHFQVSTRIVSTIWKKAKQQLDEGRPITLTNQKKGMQNNMKMQVDIALIQEIPLRQRSTLRRLAKGLGVSKSTVGRWLKRGEIKAHSNAINPDLTAVNKVNRLKFILQALHVDNILNVVKFKDMHQTIHIDEKWFNLSKTTERYYLTQDEPDPYRSCKSKRFITEVMFLSAVSRPKYATDGQLIFYGKIGIFPFIKIVPAKRNIKNRVAGTLETKVVDSITKDVTKQCLITQVIPAIKAKWPSCASKDVMIQQDNARPHIKDCDQEFRDVANADGFNIHLVFQPPNSPDTNINDLGFFRAIQSLQEETAAKTVDELLNAVHTSFETMSHSTLNKVFLSLQSCMVEIIKVKDHNNYKVPHLGKDCAIRENRLPTDLVVDDSLVKECIDYLVEVGDVEGLGELMGDLGYAI